MNRRYSAQPLIAHTEAELQMHINNALRNSKKPVVYTENSRSSNFSYPHQHITSINSTANFKPVVYDSIPVSNDTSFEIIHKKSAEIVQQTQNVTLKYLKPPPLPPHGHLVIKEEDDVQLPPSSPVHKIERPEQPLAPQPRVIREDPPCRPPVLPREEIVIPGKVLPPPPRQKIIEKLPFIPAPPPPLVIERWLGYPEQTRQVKFIPGKKLLPLAAPKNVIIKWDTPAREIKQKLHFTGVCIADPDQYRAKYGSNLYPTNKLPNIVSRFLKNVPVGEVLGANQVYSKPRLVGDVGALSFLNSSRIERRISSVTAPTYHSHSIVQDYSIEGSNIVNSETVVSAMSEVSGTENLEDIISESNFNFDDQVNHEIEQIAD